MSSGSQAEQGARRAGEFGHDTEWPDIGSSSDDYAKRFSGEVGRHFLDVQRDAVLELLRPWRGARILDVGGGHAQLAGPLREAGYDVTVLGSATAYSDRPRRLCPDVPFVTGSLLDPPFCDGAFDVALAVRLLAHLPDWRLLVRGLGRVARRAVLVEFSSGAGLNAAGGALFGLKKRVEGNTRAFHSIARSEIEREFALLGYGECQSRAQFFWPMALHRLSKSAGFARAMERVPHRLGLTARIGSPVILCAARERVLAF
jgi:SAM-dependent methyltransferase